MASDTRERFLDKAEALFAERGFYGVSIAAIGDEMGLTKQAMLHHFGSKEKLYGAVLARISARFEQFGDRSAQTAAPTERLTSLLLELQSPTTAHADQIRLLMRELLDNRRRADTAATWYLKPFLERLIAMVQDVPNWSDASPAEALALVYQWLGAINYFAVSGPTLAGIFSDDGLRDVAEVFPGQLERLIKVTLAAGPAP